MEKRYIPALIIFGIICVYCIFVLTLVNDTEDLVPIFPGNAVADNIGAMLVPILACIVSAFISVYILEAISSLYLRLYAKTRSFFIQPYSIKRSGGEIIKRVFIPGLFAINIGIYLASNNATSFLFISSSDSIHSLPIAIEFASCFVGIPITALIVGPIWIMMDSGLTQFSIVRTENGSNVKSVQGVGNLLYYYVRGYVGISTIVSYALILANFFSTETGLLLFLIVFIDPIIMVLLFVILSMLLEWRNENNLKKFSIFLERHNIDLTPRKVETTPITSTS